MSEAQSNTQPQAGVREIYTSIPNLPAFKSILEANKGIIIIKLGAEWCGPCKRVEGLIGQAMNAMPANIQCYILDVDDNFDIYGLLKTKRVVNGIPAVLAYNMGTTSYIPDDMVIGADSNKIVEFFRRCAAQAAKF